MNDVAAQKIMNYIDKYLFEPQCDWDKQIFKERSYSRWAAFYILEQLTINPFVAPDDIIEEFIIKWTIFSCINEDTEANFVFTIASDTAEELLKLIKKEKAFSDINSVNIPEECNEEMVVYKKCKMMVHPRDIKVGDQIEVPLDGIGTFMATAHQITDEGILFMFDDCIARKQINSNGGNKGGFEKSELAKWMESTLYDAFPEELKKRLRYITLPSYGQLFGHDEWYEKAIMPDDDEQLPLMKIRKNRICAYENDNCWYWLRNATKKDYSSDSFATVNGSGFAYWTGANGDYGVRPAFLIG